MTKPQTVNSVRNDSPTYRVNSLFSLQCKHPKLASSGFCILCPLQSVCTGVPKHLERCEAIRRSDAPRLSSDISSNGGGRSKPLSRIGIQSHTQSTDRFQFRLQRLNQRQKFSAGSGTRRVFVLGNRVCNSGQIALCPMQTRPQAKHGELASCLVFRFPLPALRSRQAERNVGCDERTSSPEPRADRGDGSPISAAATPEETRNNQICWIHGASLLACEIDSATRDRQGRRAA